MTGGGTKRDGPSNPFAVIDRVAAPAFDLWGPPTAPVVAWVATHLAAMTVFIAAVIAGPTGVAGVAASALWVAGSSGLVLRLARHLAAMSAGRGGLDAVPAGHRQLSPSTKAGAFLVVSHVAYLTLHPAGTGAVAAFAAALTVTTGVRVAGLDAWEGRERERLFYVRAVCSWRGLGTGCLAVVTAAALFWSMAAFVDPRVGGFEDVPGWLGAGIDTRREQFLWLVTGTLALLPPTLLVCEAIALAASYDRRLVALAAAQERRAERAEFAGALHDRALAIAQEVRRRCSDRDHELLAVQLEYELRALQRSRQEDAAPADVRAALRRGAQLANELGLDLELDADARVLSHRLPPDVAVLLESLLLVHVGNSRRHRATTSRARISVDADHVRFEYVDDGGGFDPDAAFAAGGGLATIRNRIERLGGGLALHRGADGTVAHAGIPLG